MWFPDEIARLLQSDVGGASVDQLTSPFGLWVRNTLIHAGAGFGVYFLHMYVAAVTAVHVWCVYGAYIGLQLVQVFTAQRPIAAIGDGLLDIVVAFAGFALAWAVATRDVAR